MPLQPGVSPVPCRYAAFRLVSSPEFSSPGVPSALCAKEASV